MAGAYSHNRHVQRREGEIGTSWDKSEARPERHLEREVCTFFLSGPRCLAALGWVIVSAGDRLPGEIGVGRLRRFKVADDDDQKGREEEGAASVGWAWLPFSKAGGKAREGGIRGVRSRYTMHEKHGGQRDIFTFSGKHHMSCLCIN